MTDLGTMRTAAGEGHLGREEQHGHAQDGSHSGYGAVGRGYARLGSLLALHIAAMRLLLGLLRCRRLLSLLVLLALLVLPLALRMEWNAACTESLL